MSPFWHASDTEAFSSRLGLLFRNPIVPAAVVLIWEAANPVLPGALEKDQRYLLLEIVVPGSIPLDPGMPPLFALLVSNPQPISSYVAVIGLLALSVAVLAVSAKRVRRLEINYTME